MDLSVFYNQFREETVENLRLLNDGLLSLEKLDAGDPTAKATVDAIFRAVHTIKGSSRLLGFEDVGRIAHVMEHILGAIREGRRTLSSALADELLRGGDAIQELTNAAVEGRSVELDVDALVKMLGRGMPGERERDAAGPTEAAPQAAEPPPVRRPRRAAPAEASPVAPAPVHAEEPPAPVHAPAAAASAPASRRGKGQTVRVRVDRLDRLINLAGELTVGQHALVAHRESLNELRTLVQQQTLALATLEAELHRMRFSSAERRNLEQHMQLLHDTAGRARAQVERQIDRFEEQVEQNRQIVSDLEQEVMAVRLLPVSTVFANLPRAVRDLANSLGKQVELELHGESTELDRKLLEALNDPLLHLVRNAVDHGIETPNERTSQGKAEVGRLVVRAEAAGGEVRMSISDDGRGMEPQRLRDSAVRKRLISAENAAMLSDQEALELVFLPGFSTAALITDISGRGVGMDVVRTNIGELGGQVLVDSHVGQGTTFTLVLPLTLVTTRVLMVRAGGAVFAVPASGCRGTSWVYPDQIHTLEGQATVHYQGRTVPLLRLGDLLGQTTPQHNTAHNRMPTLFLGHAQRMVGFLVDGVLDEREAVVKPLGTLLEAICRSKPTLCPYGGVVQPGDGSLVLLLNPHSLLAGARGMAYGESVSRTPTRRHHLLVTDDSFTTREMMRSILQSAGYTVTTAFDGMDALDKLRVQTYDLLVSDVEMPRMTGFQLTASVRRELGNTSMPVIIITSLASDEHRQQGMEAGAQAYIVKSQFNQDNLLGTIQQLLDVA
ncbi:MAG: hybrid sensor histidine kinase/response regulator [Chloroflexaceae bacterium]|jgi:two-component system chemotaxis sensor kinase CheA|nr:hybrid sensor histidine kinase/response regulator [Chloroflexaceae bacterium]